MKRGSVLAVTTLFLATLAAPAAAQRTEEFRWQGAVAAGETVTVHGINGGIEATPAAGDRVEVVAVKRGKESDPAEVRIDVRQDGRGVTICAVYPGQDACGKGKVRKNDVEVEFAVRVPRGVHLAARTVNGSIDAKSLTGDVHATTVNGGIEVVAAGAVEATTVNGAIRASSGRASWSGTLAFKTVNGSIDVTLPASTNANVEAKTVNGSLSSEFPLTVEGRWGPRRMEGTIGAGGGALRLETVNGAIRLNRA